MINASIDAGGKLFGAGKCAKLLVSLLKQYGGFPEDRSGATTTLENKPEGLYVFQ